MDKEWVRKRSPVFSKTTKSIWVCGFCEGWTSEHLKSRSIGEKRKKAKPFERQENHVRTHKSDGGAVLMSIVEYAGWWGFWQRHGKFGVILIKYGKRKHPGTSSGWKKPRNYENSTDGWYILASHELRRGEGKMYKHSERNHSNAGRAFPLRLPRGRTRRNALHTCEYEMGQSNLLGTGRRISPSNHRSIGNQNSFAWWFCTDSLIEGCAACVW